MSSLGNKQIFAKNLKKYMEASKKTQKDICQELGLSESTFSDWANARNYPRIDKIELLANYFGVQKADLIEENNQPRILKDAYFSFAKEMQENEISEEDMKKLWGFYELIKNK